MDCNCRTTEPSIVFFDIDGTLCRYEDAVTAGIRECFSLMHERGHRLFICTGRSPADISQDILSLGFDGMVAGMGAIVMVKNDVLRHTFIPHDMLVEDVQMLLDMKIPALILGFEEVLRTPYMIPSMLETGVVESSADLFRKGRVVDISSFDIEFEDLESIRPFVDLISKHSELVVYNEHSGQSRIIGVDKANGIDLILSLPEYKGMKSYSIGDSQNDIEMLKKTDIGIAMGDAPLEVVDAAAWQAPTVEQDGVFHAMKYFGLV